MIETLVAQEGIYRDMAVAGVEVVLLLAAFLVVNGIIRLIFSRLGSIPPLHRFQGRTEAIRRRIRGLLILVCVLLAAAIVAFDGYLIFQGVDVLEHTRSWIARIPPDFWLQLGVAMAKILALVIAASVVIRRIRRGLLYLQDRAKAYEQLKANDDSIEAFFTALDRIQKNGIWLLVAVLATAMLPFPAGLAPLVALALEVYLIIALGLLLVKAVAAIVDSLQALSQKYATPDSVFSMYEQLGTLIPLLRRCLEYIIYVIVATLVMRRVEPMAPLADYGPGLVQCIGIFFLARVVVELANLLMNRNMLGDETLSESERQRRETIVPTLRGLVSYVIFFLAFVLMLRAIDFNPMPILAGAGIVGMVLGLGAQPLINDVVSGFFILMENVFLVGDFIETGSARGTVEAIELRTTRIRDPDGQLYILRNGQLGDVVNFSKGYTYAVVEVGVAYDTDLDHAYGVIAAAGKQLCADHPDVLEPTLVQGLHNFGESELTLRTLTRVKPGRHRPVARQLRKAIKEAFDREGIEIPFARRVLVFDHQSTEELAHSLRPLTGDSAG